jgi:hypothetical protein
MTDTAFDVQMQWQTASWRLATIRASWLSALFRVRFGYAHLQTRRLGD